MLPLTGLLKNTCRKTEIVYDRYHMQAQFGKDVPGSVRLEEAGRHQTKLCELKKQVETVTDKEVLREPLYVQLVCKKKQKI